MDLNKIKLLINTVKYLKPIQVKYRIFYFFRNRFFKKKYVKKLRIEVNPLVWENTISRNYSFLGKQKFEFLNIPHQFENEIDWNCNIYGKLWTYNLNYFDFLNQENIQKEEGVLLINNYIENANLSKDGLEPYPTSLRCINWIKFLSENKINDYEINQYIYNQYHNLLHNLEYHLLANHLLENGFSLLFGAYFFQDKNLLQKSKEIISKELKDQILDDGGHFELSPMYHQIILFGVLDCIKLMKLNDWKDDNLLKLLKYTASKMMSWLKEVTFDNGNIPMVNDSSFDISCSTKELLNYGEELDLSKTKIQLSDSGYRMIKNKNFELFIDIGQVGASYQPGHVHSDTFNFILNINNQPIIVDTGTSTYEKNQLRQKERSTSSHNTVQVGDFEQTEVWGGFRVAKRAKIVFLNESDGIEATHDGYKNKGILHTRNFSYDKRQIIINDKISKSTNNNSTAYFHLHDSITKPIIDGSKVKLSDNQIVLDFSGQTNIKIETYNLAKGFNITKKAYKILIKFDQNLQTNIYL